MAKVKMSLYQAITKKKTLEAEVEKIRRTSLENVTGVKFQYSQKMADGSNSDDAKKQFQASYDKIFSLLDNYNALKAAINDANASTMVNINGNSYSIANAISRYRHLAVEERYVQAALSAIETNKDSVSSHNDRVLDPQNIQSHVNVILGENTKRTDEVIASITDAYKKDNLWEIYDPHNYEEKLRKKLEEISNFKEVYHFALTSANVNTIIEVEFVD